MGVVAGCWKSANGDDLGSACLGAAALGGSTLGAETLGGATLGGSIFCTSTGFDSAVALPPPKIDAKIFPAFFVCSITGADFVGSLIAGDTGVSTALLGLGVLEIRESFVA